MYGDCAVNVEPSAALPTHSCYAGPDVAKPYTLDPCQQPCQHAAAVQVLVYGDCAVNVEPSAEELAIIAVTSAETAQAFGVAPRVAMLSYSTGVSGAGPQVMPLYQR